MKTFDHVNFKKDTVLRFRKFSKKIARTHTAAMEVMLDFFEYNSISPYETLGVNMSTLDSKIKQRFNAVIAIIKSIEKHQTRPTNAMMNLLFKEAEEDEEEEQILVEEALRDGNDGVLFTENAELEYYREAYFKVKGNLHTLNDEFETLLAKTAYVRNNFGIGYFRLNISKEEFEHLKNKLKGVHHHNTSKTNG